MNKWLFILTCLILAIPCSARTIYVDVNTPDNSDGSSWAKAYKYLQDALADARSSGDVNEIWVAKGIYTPDSNSDHPKGTGDRTATYKLVNAVALKGGYAGFGKAKPNARDTVAYEVILSGDLDNNDVDVNDPCDLVKEPTRGENSFHVVTGSHTDSNTVLDGFTITGGNANATGNSDGAGMYNDRANLTIIDCVFRDNSASDDAGGMFNRDSKLRLIYCQFIRNAAKGDEGINIGGGVFDVRKTKAEFINCLFRNNYSEEVGGAISDTGGASFENCTFIKNIAASGGAVSVGNGAKLVRCDFENNHAFGHGGGLVTEGSFEVNDCNFLNNSAAGNGAGIHNGGTGRVFRSKFNGNKARFIGGAIYTRRSIIVELSTIIGNKAASQGAVASSNEKLASIVLTNCTLADNTPAKPDGVSTMLNKQRQKNNKKE